MNEPISDHAQDASALQRRIVQLEAALLLARDATHQGNPDTLRPIQHPERFGENVPGAQGVEQSLENINLGGGLTKSHHDADTFPDSWLAESNEKLFLLPPDATSSWRIVEFSLSMVGWLHCAIRCDVFRREHDQFWSAIGYGDHSVLRQHRWMAIYLAILAASSFIPNHALRIRTYRNTRAEFYLAQSRT